MDRADLPGFTFDRTGLRPKSAEAVPLQFSEPSKSWSIKQTDEFGQKIWLTGGKFCPAAAEFSLLKPGVRLYYPTGFALRFHSKTQPYISWGEGSAADGVPSPSISWVLLSFAEKAPPFLIRFEPQKPVSVTITGSEGNWSLQTAQDYKGWVRVSLPLGSTGFVTNSAATLGKLSQAFDAEKDFWLGSTPTVDSTAIQPDADGLTVTWTFSQSLALLPSVFKAAPIGGYACEVLSEQRQLTGADEAGRLYACVGKQLKVRLPVRRVPNGRFLSDVADPAPPATASYLDLPSVVSLGLENLASSRDPSAQRLGEATFGDFLQETAYLLEPHTAQPLPFTSAGVGLDLAAGHAFLKQCLSLTQADDTEPNSLLASLAWRRDWYTGGFTGVDPVLARRAGALAALAGALAPQPERRLDGALFQAGIAASRGYQILARRAGAAPQTPLIEPLEGLRRVLFALPSRAPQTDEMAFARAMLSEFRVLGEPAVRADSIKPLAVTWQGKSTVTFLAPYAFSVMGKSAELKPDSKMFRLEVTLEAAKPSAPVVWLDPNKMFAPVVAPPTYSEPAR